MYTCTMLYMGNIFKSMDKHFTKEICFDYEFAKISCSVSQPVDKRDNFLH